MVKTQNGRRAICDRTPEYRELAIDHDHATGQVRGLLCHTHNMALGAFEDSPALLWRAITYLRQVPEKPVLRSSDS